LNVTAEFIVSAAGADDFPRDRLPEVALVGRSNVGKSSLINALVGQPVARTSAAPGKTRLANFYRLRPRRGKAFYLVDLPGYGYARGGDAAAREFEQLAQIYFSRGDDLFRPRGMAAVLLVDARHPGLDSDLSAWNWLKRHPIPKAVIATKADKLTRAERARHSRELDSLFDGPVLLVSAHTGEGLEELWKLIVRITSPMETDAQEPPRRRPPPQQPPPPPPPRQPTRHPPRPRRRLR
jgi:GTP-binding protein